MAVKRRRSKRRPPLDADQRAWLQGESDSGFIQFQSDDQLRALWDEYGDKEMFKWTEGDARPMARRLQ